MILCFCFVSLYDAINLHWHFKMYELLESHFEDHYSPLMKVTFAFIKKLINPTCSLFPGSVFPLFKHIEEKWLYTETAHTRT